MTRSTIVVGVDESPQARAALRWAAEAARGTGAPLLGIHVLEWPQASDLYAYSVVADQVYPDPHDLEEMYRTPSELVFAEVGPEPGWTLRFAQGHAGHVLVEESREARMLVVGTCEHRGLVRLLNGSTAHYCLNHATCPVVAVPCSPRVRTAASGGGSTTSRAPAR